MNNITMERIYNVIEYLNIFERVIPFHEGEEKPISLIDYDYKIIFFTIDGKRDIKYRYRLEITPGEDVGHVYISLMYEYNISYLIKNFDITTHANYLIFLELFQNEFKKIK